MRWAVACVLFAACTNTVSIEVDELATCATCGPGRVRAGFIADATVGVDGTRLVAYRANRDARIEWRSIDRRLVESTEAEADTDWSGPLAESVSTAADGHGVEIQGGYYDDISGQRVFAIGLSSSGERIWQRQLFAAAKTGAGASAIMAADGDALITVRTPATAATFDGLDVMSPLAVAKIGAADGAVHWVRIFATANDQSSLAGIAPLADGGFVMSGTIDKTLQVDPLPAISGPAAFVGRFDATGAAVWVRTFRAPGFAIGRAIAASPDGYIYALGELSGALDLGDGTTLDPPPDPTGPPAHDYVIALDERGKTAWTATPSYLAWSSIAATPRGAIIGGAHDAPAYVGSITIPAATAQSAGACVELVHGEPAWSLAFDGPGYQACRAAGMIDGRSFVAIDSWAAVGATPATTIVDGVTIDGDRQALVEIGTAP
jgi:hypothetical protein